MAGQEGATQAATKAAARAAAYYMFLMLKCLGGTRGYEVVWLDLLTLTYDLAYCKETDDCSAISVPIVRRFKCRGGICDCYMILITGKTMSKM